MRLALVLIVLALASLTGCNGEDRTTAPPHSVVPVATLPGIEGVPVSQTNPPFSSTTIATHVAELPRISYGGHITWSGDYVYTFEDDYDFGFAQWMFNADGNGVTINLVGIPANLPLEVELAFWNKEVVGSLHAMEWWGSVTSGMPPLSVDEISVILDGLAVLKLSPSDQALIGAGYPEHAYFSGRYIEWGGGLSCEEIFAIHYMSRNDYILQGGALRLAQAFDCTSVPGLNFE